MKYTLEILRTHAKNKVEQAGVMQQKKINQVLT